MKPPHTWWVSVDLLLTHIIVALHCQIVTLIPLDFLRIHWIRESGSHMLLEHSAANTLQDRGVQRGCGKVGACHCSYGNFSWKNKSDITSVFYRNVMNKSSSTINNRIAQLFEHLKSGERNTATTEEITAELKINGRFKICVFKWNTIS